MKIVLVILGFMAATLLIYLFYMLFRGDEI